MSVKRRRPNSEALNSAFDRLAEAAVGDELFPASTVFVPDDSPYSAVVVAARVTSGAPVAIVHADGKTELFVGTPTTAVTATAGAENDFYLTTSSGGFVRTVHPVLS